MKNRFPDYGIVEVGNDIEKRLPETFPISTTKESNKHHIFDAIIHMHEIKKRSILYTSSRAGVLC